MSLGCGIAALVLVLFWLLTLRLPFPGPLHDFDPPAWRGWLRFTAPLIVILLGVVAIVLGRQAGNGEQAEMLRRSEGAARSLKHDEGGPASGTAVAGMFLGCTALLAGLLALVLLFVYLSGAFMMP